MTRICFPFVLAVILLLSACQNQVLTFVGEGEQWSAKLVVGQTAGDETYYIQLGYKGDDLKAIETFSYMVKSSYDGMVDYGVNEVSLDEKGMYIGRMLTSNSPSTTSDDELTLEVQWNSESEVFTLKSK